MNDIVNGLIELSKGEHKGEIYNLGTGRNYSINQLVEFFGCNSITLPERPGEAKLSIADISKTKEDLDWEPTHSLRQYIKEFLKPISFNNLILLTESWMPYPFSKFTELFFS